MFVLFVESTKILVNMLLICNESHIIIEEDDISVVRVQLLSFCTTITWVYIFIYWSKRLDRVSHTSLYMEAHHSATTAYTLKPEYVHFGHGINEKFLIKRHNVTHFT